MPKPSKASFKIKHPYLGIADLHTPIATRYQTSQWSRSSDDEIEVTPYSQNRRNTTEKG